MFSILPNIEKDIQIGKVNCFGGGGSSASAVTPTADQITQQQINAQLWNYYETSYKPQVDAYAAKVENPEVQAEEKNQVAGQIRGEAVKNINPASVTNNAAANAKTLSNLGKVETGMQVQGQGGVRSRHLAEQQNLIDIGRGQATTAQAGLSELAGQSVSAELTNLDLEQQKTAASENAVGSIAGAIAAGTLRASNTPTNNTTSQIRQLTLGG